MSEPEENEDPKIIVDDDWKDQVQQEKTQPDYVPMDKSPAEPQNVEPVSTAPGGVADENPPAPPEASFEVLISMLFTQAMATLGQIPDPVTGEPKINKPFAKHYIDTLEMLGEKTEGNTTDAESKMLSDALHALRMAYVNTKG